MSDVYLAVCIHRREGSEQPSCAARGGMEVLAALRAEAGDLTVETCHCFGRCAQGPVVRIGPGGPFRYGVRVADVPDLLEQAQRFAIAKDAVPATPALN